MDMRLGGTEMTTRNRPWVLGLIALAAMMSSACASMTINKLLAEPERYTRRDVTLRGDVVKSASVLGHGAYELDDGTGRIWVVSKRGVPRKGAHIKTTGRVKDVVDLGGVIDLPRELKSGLVLVERDHEAD
jgi:hypothetical protein